MNNKPSTQPRRYRAVITTRGTFDVREVVTRHRIRFIAHELYRRWFGRPCTESWHKDGFMAEACDRSRGNSVELIQENGWDWTRRSGSQRAARRIRGLLTGGAA